MLGNSSERRYRSRSDEGKSRRTQRWHAICSGGSYQSAPRKLKEMTYDSIDDLLARNGSRHGGCSGPLL
jgi:hypothetical protein